MIEPAKKAKAHAKKALDYLGKKLQLDVYYFLRGGFWLSSAHLLTGMAAFLVVIAFTRLASKEFYGQYQFIMAIIAILTIFSLPGMQTAIIQAVSRGEECIAHSRYKKTLPLELFGKSCAGHCCRLSKIYSTKRHLAYFSRSSVFISLFV